MYTSGETDVEEYIDEPNKRGMIDERILSVELLSDILGP